MSEALRAIPQEEPRLVEIVVHLEELLNEEQRNDMVRQLESSEGVAVAEFCPLRYHLMLIQYDRDNLTSQDILERVTGQSVNARLIGPI